jgi:hypothetical protein
VNHACLQHTVHRGGDGDCIGRITVKKIGGAVEGIDDPDEPLRDQLGTQLLTHDPRRRVDGQQLVPNQPLGRPVDLGDKVVDALSGPPTCGGPLDPAEKPGGRPGRGLGPIQ